MSITPVNDRILVKVPEQKKTLIQLPDSAKEKPVEGVVIAVGDDVSICHPGDQIIFTKYASTVDIGEKLKNHIVILSKDVVCKINGEQNELT